MIKSFIDTLPKKVAAPASDKLKIAGLDYPFEQGYYLTNKTGHPHAFIGYQYYPIIWTIKDKTFLAWNQRDNDPYNNESMMLVYDHETKKVSHSVAWGEINPPNADVHLVAAIIGTADDKILMLEENPHIGPIHIKKSGNNFNIQSYTYHNSFTADMAYPHIHKYSDGTLFCIFRASTSATAGLNEESGAKIFKSTDNGITWTDLGMITFFNWDGVTNEWAYPLTPYSSDNKLRLFVNHRRGIDPVSFPMLYYIESTDGINWTNIDGTFTKNISAGNHITLTEMETHCLVLKYGTGAVGDGVIRANGTVLDENGNPYCIGGHSDDAHSVRFIGWNGTAWFSKPIVVPGHNIYGTYVGTSADPNTVNPFNNNTTIVSKGAGAFDCYLMENVGGYAHLSLFRTTDYGNSWAFVRQLTEGYYHHWNQQSTANLPEYGKGIISCVRRSPDESYGDLFIQEL